jgi:hypothetical protein
MTFGRVYHKAKRRSTFVVLKHAVLCLPALQSKETLSIANHIVRLTTTMARLRRMSHARVLEKTLWVNDAPAVYCALLQAHSEKEDYE